MAIQERDFERLMNQARVQLPGASDAGLKGVMFDVIDEFFDTTNSWIEWFNFALSDGNQAYQIYPQYGGMFNRLVTVVDTNHVVYPASISFGEQLTSQNPGAQATYVAPPGVILTFVNPISAPVNVSAMLTKKTILPNNRDDIPDAPSWLFPLYARYILEGVVGTLMMQKAKSYSDPTAASYHLKRFRDGMDMAKVATIRAGLYGGQAWRFPMAFATSSQRGNVSTAAPRPTP